MSEIRVNNLSNESLSGGPTISGITTFSSPYLFTPPVGDTANRSSSCPPGSLRFNTDSAHLEYYRGDTIGWQEVEAELTAPLGASGNSGHGHRGIIVGGGSPGATSDMEFHTIPTFGSSTDFGDLYSADRNVSNGQAGNSTRMVLLCGDKPGPNIHADISSITFSTGGTSDSGNNMTLSRRLLAGFSDSTRACAAGGYEPYSDVIDFTTISSLSTGVDFGNLSAQRWFPTGSSSSTRGVIIAGYNNSNTALNIIEYVTISTTGNAIDFGDAQTTGQNLGVANNSTRIVFAEGGSPSIVNTISFLTTATTGNAIDFGDIVGTNRRDGAGTSSPTRGIFSCGYDGSSFHDEQDAVELATTGNSVDFGDAANGNKFRLSSGSSGHGGL